MNERICEFIHKPKDCKRLDLQAARPTWLPVVDNDVEAG
jgi:hypothetical protein